MIRGPWGPSSEWFRPTNFWVTRRIHWRQRGSHWALRDCMPSAASLRKTVHQICTSLVSWQCWWLMGPQEAFVWGREASKMSGLNDPRVHWTKYRPRMSFSWEPLESSSFCKGTKDGCVRGYYPWQSESATLWVWQRPKDRTLDPTSIKLQLFFPICCPTVVPIVP